MTALRVFLPQILLGSIATGAGTAIAALQAHPVALVPLVAITVATGLLTVITTAGKAVNIEIRGWDQYAPKPRERCRGCTQLAAITKDRDKLREALAVLQLPPERP